MQIVTMCRWWAVGLFAAVVLDVARAQPAAPGQLVVVLASKGQFRGEADRQGMEALAEIAHQRGFPVTWLLKPAAAREMAARLKSWHQLHGDEVGWFAEYSEPSAIEEFDELKKAVTWHPVRSAGHTRYDLNWVRLAEKLGITGVWGRCFEQTYADNIIDRGSPFGFYYLRPDCYKVPSTNDRGLVSVPWLSGDINLVFRTGWASGFTFDPDDVLNIGVVRGDDIGYWKALVDEHQRQTAYNAFVPLVIQQEYTAVGDALRRKDTEGLEALAALLDYLKEERIKVVGMAEAVQLYQRAHPKRTPPTYALFDNLGRTGLAAAPRAHPKTGKLHQLRVVTNRITQATAGKPFNGFFANDYRDGVRSYVHPAGKTYTEHGALFAYYDTRGLLMFDEGQAHPVRITPYGTVAASMHKPVVLPEMSMWYNTDRLIPEPVIESSDVPGGLKVAITATWSMTTMFPATTLPYGIVLWGDYSRYRLPTGIPEGSRLLGDRGLFIAMPLKVGENKLELQLARVR